MNGVGEAAPGRECFVGEHIRDDQIPTEREVVLGDLDVACHDNAPPTRCPLFVEGDDAFVRWGAPDWSEVLVHGCLCEMRQRRSHTDTRACSLQNYEHRTFLDG